MLFNSLVIGWTGDNKVDFLVGGEACRPTLLPIASKSKRLLNVCKYHVSCILFY